MCASNSQSFSREHERFEQWTADGYGFMSFDYRGFPGSLCTSPNSMVVHGIPGPYALRKGDVLSVDCGVILDGWVADAARTLFSGGPATFGFTEVSPMG